MLGLALIMMLASPGKSVEELISSCPTTLPPDSVKGGVKKAARFGP
jgi:hypothetical protein